MKEKHDLVNVADATGEKKDPTNTLEFVLNQHQAIIQEKDRNIDTLKSKIKAIENEKVCCLRSGMSETEMFKIKPKQSVRKKKEGASIELKCEFTGCENDNIDLVKCNLCEKWVCEDCNDVNVGRLKQVVNKCKNVFFICKGCEPNLKRCEQKESHEVVSTLKILFDTKVNEVESKLANLIETKLGEKNDAVSNTNPEEKKKQEETYAKVLAVPAELKKMFKEVRNDEKVEDTEMEKRSKNFIIHGAAEIGENAKEIEKNDEQYIKDILYKIGVGTGFESVTRLGKPNENRQRTIKIVMKTSIDKDNVLGNLSKLKGTVEEFGKISITSDYTKTERDQIKAMSEKAKAQSAADKDRVYKVRGDPKNGLKIVSFRIK